MALSQETLDKINKAFADLDTSKQKDAALAQRASELAAAQLAKDAAQKDDEDAKALAAQSAKDAVDALKLELGLS